MENFSKSGVCVCVCCNIVWMYVCVCTKCRADPKLGFRRIRAKLATFLSQSFSLSLAFSVCVLCGICVRGGVCVCVRVCGSHRFVCVRDSHAHSRCHFHLVPGLSFPP